MSAAIKIAAAGFGAAFGGPLGAALGGMVGTVANDLVQDYARRFGEQAGEKLFDVFGDKLSEKTKSSPVLQDVYRSVLRAALKQLHMECTRPDNDGEAQGWKSWFENWEIALAPGDELKLRPVTSGRIVLERLDELFLSCMEELDTRGLEKRQQGTQTRLRLRNRTLPKELSSILLSDLPKYLQEEFDARITEPENERAWKQLLLLRVEQLAEIVKTHSAIHLDLVSPGDFSVESSGFNKFHYRWRSVRFVGRENEVRLLKQFLDQQRNFLWFAVTGPAGSGKSRLALEIGLQTQPSWDAGFPRLELDPKDFQTWVPRKPTLIFIDYVQARLESTKSLIAVLQSRCSQEPLPCPVRILLLERDAKGPWLTQLLNGSEGVLVEQARYRGLESTTSSDRTGEAAGPVAPFLELGSLDRSALSSIFDQMLAQTNINADSRSELRARLLTQLAALDPSGRPLFAAILAGLPRDEGQRVTSTASIHTVLEGYIDHERKCVWEHLNIDANDEGLLALATICGGFDLDHNDAPRVDRDALNRYRLICGKAFQGTLPPLEPDIVGEFFALSHWTQASAVRKDGKKAWLLNSEGMGAFLSHAAQDFPTHKYLGVLNEYPNHIHPSKRVLWMTANVDLIAAWIAAGQKEQAGDALKQMWSSCQELMSYAAEDIDNSFQVASDATLMLRTVLMRMERQQDAIDLCDTIHDRFSPLAEAKAHELVAIALSEKALIALVSKKHDLALAATQEVIRRFGFAKTVPLAFYVARSMISQGVALGLLSGSADAISMYSEVVTRFENDPNPSMQGLVSEALIRKGKQFSRLGSYRDAISACDEVFSRFERLDLEEGIAAEALGLKSFCLRESGRNAECLSTADVAVRRFGGATEQDIRNHVASTLLNKSLSLLGTPDRQPEAILVCDEIIERFRDDKAMLQDFIANALLTKGSALVRVGRMAEALDVFNDLFSNCNKSGDPESTSFLAGARDEIVALLVLSAGTSEIVAAYDAMALRAEGTLEPQLREDVARALFDIGCGLRDDDRKPEALELLGELIVRFRDSVEPGIRAQVARAMLEKGELLEEPDGIDNAMEVYDELVERFEQDPELGALEQVAKAMFYKGLLLGQSGRTAEQVVLYDQMIRRYEDYTAPTIREQVARVLFNKGDVLREAGQYADAIEVFSDLLSRFAQDNNPGVGELCASAMLNKGLLLGETGLMKEAMEIVDELIDDFKGDLRPEVRAQVAQACFLKANFSDLSGNPEAASRLYTEVDDRFGQDTEPSVREWVSGALSNRMIVCSELGRPDSAFDVVEDLLSRFGEDTDPATRENVARALLNKGLLLQHASRFSEAVLAYDDVLTRFTRDTGAGTVEAVATAWEKRILLAGEPEGIAASDAAHITGESNAATSHIQEVLDCFDVDIRQFEHELIPRHRRRAAAAFLNKARYLVEKGRSDEAIGVFTELDLRFGRDVEPDMRDLVASALRDKLQQLLERENAKEAALEVCDALVDRCGYNNDTDSREDVAMALGVKSILLVECGRSEEAIRVCDALLKDFGTNTEAGIRLCVSECMTRKALLLQKSGLPAEAIRVLDELVKWAGNATEQNIQVQVAAALCNKARLFQGMGDSAASLKACDECIETCCDFQIADTAEALAGILEVKRSVLRSSKGAEAAIAFGLQYAEAYGDQDIPILQTVVIDALWEKASSTDDASEKLMRLEEIETRFANIVDPVSCPFLVAASFERGNALVRQGRAMDALAAYDGLVSRFGASPEAFYVFYVAAAVLEKARTLSTLDRWNEALICCNQAIKRLGGFTEEWLQSIRAQALYSKGIALTWLDRPEEARATYEALIAAFGSSTDPRARNWIDSALINLQNIEPTIPYLPPPCT